MNGPAVWPRLFVATEFRALRAPGSVPMCAEYMPPAEASVRASACALAMRARAWMFAYSGIAMAARIPMIATTIISSMSVKPRWLPSIFRFLCQKASTLISFMSVSLCRQLVIPMERYAFYRCMACAKRQGGDFRRTASGGTLEVAQPIDFVDPRKECAVDGTPQP